MPDKIYVKLSINDDSRVVEIDGSTKLKDVRTQASSFIGTFDLFLMDGATVNKKDEDKIEAKAIWLPPKPQERGDGEQLPKPLHTINLKRPSNKKHDFSKIDTSNKVQATIKDPKYAEHKDEVSGQITLDTNTGLKDVKSAKNFFELSLEERSKVIVYNQLDHGLIMDGQNFQKSMFCLVQDLKFHALTPQKTVEYHTLSTFSKQTRDVANATGYAGSIKVVTPYAEGGVEAQKNASENELKENQELHVVSFCKFPKVHLLIDRKALTPSEGFKQAVDKAIKGEPTRGNEKIFYNESFLKLKEVLDEYGYYFPTSFRLGGTLKTNKTLTKETATTITAAEQAVSGSLSASIGGYGGEASLGYKNTGKEKKEDVNQKLNLSIEAIGGNPAYINSQNLFAQSLAESVSSWGILDYRKLIPSIELLELSVASKCAKIINGADDKFKHDTEVDWKNYTKSINTIVADKID